MINFFEHVRYNSPEWTVMKAWLEEQHKTYIRKLVNASSHDESNELRGAIKLIDKLLLAEKDARTRASN